MLEVSEFRVFLRMLICADPWPLTEIDEEIAVAFANRQAIAMGFEDWTDAYHRL